MIYQALRQDIKSGDCILWQGNGLLSRLIMLYGGYSHASLVVRLDEYDGLKDRIFLVEALPSGLELRLASKRIEEYNGCAFHFRPDGITDKQRETAACIALDACAKGIKYDFGSLIRNALARVNINVRTFFCSEFVWWVWEGIGLVERRKTAPRPGDLPRLVEGVLTSIG